ncbi:MAG: MBL fold metallo-hydrolase [Terriglobia bacterium]|nr:MAG: MBL fold metallo-hydrolase [Terriglobia bacterium]
MSKPICVTCGVQYPDSAVPPPDCPICGDARQYVGFGGQQWTTIEEIAAKHSNRIEQEEPNLHSIHTQPGFAIGQRAFLVQTGAGNVLWDCVSLLDESTIAAIRALGGIQAIAISHPHYYSTMIDWSETFGGVPIYIHEADARWVMRPDPHVRFWPGASIELPGSLTLICTPGHFDGFQVLRWPHGSERGGVLLSGDQPQVCMDPRWVSFMYSYPNFIPLSGASVRRIVEILRPWKFDRIYGAFPHRTVRSDAKAVLQRSAERYLAAIEGELAR